MRTKQIYTFICILCFSYSFAQNSKVILCKIVDIESRYAVSFATIQFKGEAKGLVANAAGSFRLPEKFRQTNRQIIISSIGYETVTVNVISLDDKSINTIFLKPKIESLEAVFISTEKSKHQKKESSLTIIKKAISKIPNNYPYQAHSYMGYYRDYQVVNGNYYNLNEGIIEDFDAGFSTNKLGFKGNRTALYSYKLNKDFYQDSLLLNSIYGESKILDEDDGAELGTKISNELEILNIHNPIRNFDVSSFSSIYVLKDDFTKNHNFEIPKIVFMDNHPLYEIEFYTKVNDRLKFRAEGKLYISKSTYAIYRLNYHVLENADYTGSRSNSGSYGFSNPKFKDANTLFKVNIEYKKVGDKMYLNYMTFNNRFIIKEPNPFKVSSFEFDKNDKAFYVIFNKPVDEASITNRSRFKLYFKEKKLIVKDVKLTENNVVKIKVVSWSAGTKTNLSDIVPEDFTYKLRRIKDVSGLTINRVNKLVGFQFREFFTQEIFKIKTPTSNLIYMDKTKPISSSKLNNNKFNINEYWVNSPLKQTDDVNK